MWWGIQRDANLLGVQVEVRNEDQPYLTLYGNEGEDESMAAAFWQTVSASETLLPEGGFDELAVPPRWVQAVEGSPLTQWRPWRTRPSPIEFVVGERRRERGDLLAEVLGDTSLRLPDVRDMEPATLRKMMSDAWRELRLRGARLLGCDRAALPDTEAPAMPLGLTRILDRAVCFPDPNPLARVGEALRATFPGYATSATFYTAGFQALSETYPAMGSEGMKDGSPQATQYIPELLAQWYEITVARFVDCMEIQTDQNHPDFHEATWAPTQSTWR